MQKDLSFCRYANLEKMRDVVAFRTHNCELTNLLKYISYAIMLISTWIEYLLCLQFNPKRCSRCFEEIFANAACN